MSTVTYNDIERVNAEMKSTDIKGKEYAEVPQRIKAFRKLFPLGKILTNMLSNENGVCVFRAEIYADNDTLLGTGTAYEKENSTFINKTSYIENCVPLDTLILTKNGWKYYYQLNIGDEVLSCNLETNNIEYCKVLNINLYKDKEITELKNSRFSVMCTPEHKWVTRAQYQPISKTRTKDLKASQKIVQAIKQDVTASELGRKLGWLMCDCEINKTKNGMPSTAYIRQSKYIDDIEELFGRGNECKSKNSKWLTSYEWIIKAEEVRRILGSFDICTYKDLANAMLKANIEDVKGCYDSMMLADGSDRGFSSTYIELIEAVQIMCARLGIATTFITERMCNLSTKPIYTLGIKKTDGVYVSELKTQNLPPQDVWCPTTENGTWFMKQGSFVTLTSNCETSAVGRALGMCGFGIDTSVASAEEISNAIVQQATAPKPKKQLTPREKLIAKLKEKGVNIDEYAKEKGLTSKTTAEEFERLLAELEE